MSTMSVSHPTQEDPFLGLLFAQELEHAPIKPEDANALSPSDVSSHLMKFQQMQQHHKQQQHRDQTMNQIHNALRGKADATLQVHMQQHHATLDLSSKLDHMRAGQAHTQAVSHPVEHAAAPGGDLMPSLSQIVDPTGVIPAVLPLLQSSTARSAHSTLYHQPRQKPGRKPKLQRIEDQAMGLPAPSADESGPFAGLDKKAVRLLKNRQAASTSRYRRRERTAALTEIRERLCQENVQLEEYVKMLESRLVAPK
ncbi:hypothetical protein CAUPRSCDRAFT_10880 [Caulochytrium protostelioides]|uniref:BZIP domain-containing protein n=1 Tax=Caulochytrium protostelioides TaxID=1555241 RepID=A0A4V1ITL2_9FUNG|nr:hypothetical protein CAUPRSCDRAFT_10880 [Caulochytrium protostelioides]